MREAYCQKPNGDQVRLSVEPTYYNNMAYWLIVQRCTLTYWENNAKTKMDPRQYNLLVVCSTLYDTKIATHQTTNTIHWVGEGTFIN